MDDNDLVPCPFCGEQFTYIWWMGRPKPHHNEYAVRCPACGMHGPIELSEEKAGERYNMLKVTQKVTQNKGEE
jgi:endogenous inhibitor of DNA gyrase (YacG/DUF329 family)